jgi:Fe-S-cluster-containing dehydrogenase component
MKKLNLIVDVALCQNCNNCVLSAKDEFTGNTFPGYTAPHAAQGPAVIRLERTVRGESPMIDSAYLPVMCNHCDDAPCMKAANGAIRKRDDGIVLIDPELAKGRRDLVGACPYGAIVWNEEQQLPQSWFFDAHLLDAGWPAPRCATVCPTNVFEVAKVEDGEMAARAREEGLRTLPPQAGARPRVYYRHLERIDHCFIGGSVAARQGGQTDCVSGASVQLRKSGTLLAQAVTDAFGDFKFDGLPGNSGDYEVGIQHAHLGATTLVVTLDATSRCLGEILLAAG